MSVSPRTGMMFLGAAGLALIAGFVYLIHVADGVDPQRAEKRIELPNAFKN